MTIKSHRKVAVTGAIAVAALSAIIAFSDFMKPVSTAIILDDYPEPAPKLAWYQTIGTIRAQIKDSASVMVIVEPSIGYRKGDKIALRELDFRTDEIKNCIQQFFSRCSIEDLQPDNEVKLRILIRNDINDSILTQSKIRDIKFMVFDVEDNNAFNKE